MKGRVGVGAYIGRGEIMGKRGEGGLMASAGGAEARQRDVTTIGLARERERGRQAARHAGLEAGGGDATCDGDSAASASRRRQWRAMEQAALAIAEAAGLGKRRQRNARQQRQLGSGGRRRRRDGRDRMAQHAQRR